MTSYRLVYFDGRGRAEVARILFTLADLPFEDKRVPMEEWPDFKPSTPFDQVPVLEVDGQPFGQSVAINNYLAREFSYYGKTNLEKFAIDQVVMVLEDFINENVRAILETEEAKKEKMLQSFAEETCPKYMGYLEDLLKANGDTGYLVGDSLTLADLSAYMMVYNTDKRVRGLYDAFPGVQNLMRTVEDHPKIKSYLATRIETEY